MVRKSFIKELEGKELNMWDTIEDILLYNKVVTEIRHFHRFLKRLPKWLKLCWKTENWDYEGIYYFFEMQLSELIKAQEEDTWHVPDEVRARVKQIKLVQEHLKRYMDPFKYYEWPKTEFIKTDHETYKMEFVDKEHGQEKADFFHAMEKKHFNKFWDLIKKWHTGWWT